MEKLITPVQYDTIDLSWFRVKDYIFVQNGAEYFNGRSKDYDVYTFQGERIVRNKPNPKNHRNND